MSTFSRPYVRGRPGGHASMLASKSLSRVVYQRAAAFLLAAAGAVVTFTAGPVGLVPIGVAGLLVAATGSEYGRYRRAKVGADAERRVARTLERHSGAAAVVHGALLGAGGDADHVVLGPMAAVVETKYGRGHPRLRDDGVTVGDRRLVGDPAGQAQRQAQQLSRYTQTPAVAVLCISHGTGRPQRRGDLVVCNPRQLRKVLRRLPRALSDKEAVRVAARLTVPEESPAKAR